MTDTTKTVEPVAALVWDEDGRALSMDDTMSMGKGYDWDGFECFRQEAYGKDCGYIIWPDHIGRRKWNLYGTADGLYVQNLDGELGAKLRAQQDYSSRLTPTAAQEARDARIRREADV